VLVFPPVPAPPAPFPLVLSASMQSSFVAPGVERATYHLSTSAGPLVVYVVAVDLREPTLRLRAVLASDRLISAGETVSSMAARTGAVAGVNADYYDIGQTNQPLGIVVRDGALVRTPSSRIALAVTRGRTVRFANFHFAGSVTYGSTVVPLTTVDEWPPQGGASYLTPAYGTLRAAAGVRVAYLEPAAGTNGIAGTYRVVSVAEATGAIVPRGPLLAFGPAALKLAPPPLAGDSVAIAATLDPALDDIATAVGGGPLLIAGGNPATDPNAPAPEERDRRFPVSGAATAADGTLLLIAVDGRQAALSVGVTRPEFGALMLGLGASDGMAFDSGGSATLAARVPGDESASVLNAPSDGSERPVADGLFVYSDAPYGLHPHLILRPERFEALPGALVTLRAAVVDDAGHRLRDAGTPAIRAALEPGDHVATVRALQGRETGEVKYRTVTGLKRLTIDPDRPNPEAGGTLRLRARGLDADGTPVELGDAVRWSTNAGSIDADGTYRAAAADASVVATAGGISTRVEVRVGRHETPLELFSPPAGDAWRFATFPRGGPGSLTFSPGASELRLGYDFGGDSRAAYANGAFTLPGAPLGFGIDVLGDGNGAGLRAVFQNRFGERRVLTLVKAIDWQGWRRVTIVLPPDLNPPVTLASLYAVATLGAAPVRAAGTVVFRNPAVVIAGSP
jgi:hypothetical protein